MNEQGIQVPAGTIVNGLPFEKYQTLQKRIAELEEELKTLKPEPSIPDWIAPGKWVKSKQSFNCYHVTKLVGDKVYYKKDDGEDWLYMQHCTPFTPPPCPELPMHWKWFDDKFKKVQYLSNVMSFDAWLAAVNVDSNSFFTGVPEKLQSIRDWREKWA